MMKVYQIHLTEEERELLNEKGWGASPKIAAYADRSFDDLFKLDTLKYYDHVANVNAVDLESAFMFMNVGIERYIEQVSEQPYYSMSVGDVVEYNGKLYRCASFGFKEIELNCPIEVIMGNV